LLFYDKIADIAKEHLTINGLLFFEINQYLGTETVEMLHKKGFENIELRKDLFGKDRMIQCSFFESESKD
jgi:release factor glutamine methyltransferase